jgi:hypothetical protein
MVLSDNERQTLLDVERRFMAEDPEFTRSFATRLEHRHLDGGLAKIAIVAAASPPTTTVIEAGPRKAPGQHRSRALAPSSRKADR